MSAFAYFDQLRQLIASREGADPKLSHVAKMLKKGPRRIAKKVGEEGVEVAIAAVAQPKEHVVSESCDLIFHLMILWHALGITPEEIVAEFQRREGVSGIVEKQSRVEE